MSNTGAASIPEKFIILKTSGGPRSTTGAPQTIQSSSSTDDDCRTGDTVKYTNLHLQCGPRNAELQDERTGWLEWALVLVRENETEVPITRVGVQTLGDICTNMYRGECIYSGNFPVGGVQPSMSEVKIKIPLKKQKIKLGDEWRLITYFRSVLSTAVSTQGVRLVRSYNHIVYS